MCETTENRTWTSGGGFGLSGFVLKIIACLTMAVDHVGALLFPDVIALRIVGRFAFPLFAFLFAEGDRFTRHPVRRMLTVAAVGAVCELVGDLMSGQWNGNIMITLTVSALLAFLLKKAKAAAFGDPQDHAAAVVWVAAFACAVAAAGTLTYFVYLDYGFAGIMTPVLVGLFDFRGLRPPAVLATLDCFASRLALFALGLLWLSLTAVLSSVQPWCLLSVVIVALYNGKRGKVGLKYAFYAFYPLHLVVIYGIAALTAL